MVFESVDMIPRHPVQLYEALSYGIIFVLLIPVYHHWKNGSRKGVLLSVFLILVFSARFLLEFLKTRQAVYEAGLSLNVGQWLSLPFIVLGLILLDRSLQSDVKVKNR